MQSQHADRGLRPVIWTTSHRPDWLTPNLNCSMLWSCRFSRCKKNNHFSVQLSVLNLSRAVVQMKKSFSNPCLGVSVFTRFMAEVRTLPTHVTSPSTTRSTTAAVRLLPPSLSTKGALTNKTHMTEARLERRHTAAPTVPESSYIQWMWVTLWQKTTWRHSMTINHRTVSPSSDWKGSFKPSLNWESNIVNNIVPKVISDRV